jgi:membrane associated rhomboid family serine protease
MRDYREYFRPEDSKPPLWLGLSSATHALILVNCAVYLSFVIGVYLVRPWLLGGTGTADDFEKRVWDTVGLVPTAAIGGGKVWQFFTYSFFYHTHDYFHLLFNMLTLYFFGREVETLYGAKRFLILYFAGAVFAGLVFCLDWEPKTLVGASGAVYGVMVAYACHYPRQRILFFFLLPLEVWVVVTILVSMDLTIQVVGGEGPAQVGRLAHLGGALFGWLFYKLEARVGLYIDRFERRVQRRDVVHEEEIEARLDTLLEKISRDGIGSLSKKERDFLKRASRHYQNKA